jgi:aldehyde dehydrogenase (NAD+)
MKRGFMNQLTFSTIPSDINDMRSYYNGHNTLSYEWRCKQLRALLRMIEEQEDHILEAMYLDLGKPRLEALATEVYFLRMEIRETLKHLKKWMKPERRKIPVWLAPAKASLIPNPLGVVLIIAPWNYPLHLCIAPLLGAVAAGNCAVIKPSELTPNVSQFIATYIPQYLDTNAIKVYEGSVEVSQVLLQQKWDHIFFTGSTRVGKIIMQAAAQHLCPVTLELGGKSPCIIDANANLKVAAKRIVWGKFINAGQTCVAPDYVMIHQDVYEDMLIHFQEAIYDFYIAHMGDQTGETSSETSRELVADQKLFALGTNSDEWQGKYAKIVSQDHFDRLMSLLPHEDKIVIGGVGDRDSQWIHPTVLRDITFEDTIMESEIFGPILPCMPVTSMNHALSLVMKNANPLAAYVFTEDIAFIDQVKNKLACGGLVINHVLLQLVATDLPFGGIGNSGIGHYHGKTSFDIFSHAKPVLEKGTWFDPPVLYPPHNSLKERLLAFFLK